MNPPPSDNATLRSHGFRPVPRTGVIYVMTEAQKHGYYPGNENWANLGQGAPETSELPGSPERVTNVSFTLEDCEYSPVVGLEEFRDAVANLYNERYRKDRKSKYTRDNVAISAGGRLALTRLVSTIGRTNIGHFLPDYTAYEELLESFGTFIPIPILLDPKHGYKFDANQLRDEILGRGLSALLLSNPCNPTGRHIHGEELKKWVQTATELDCTLILDEFYSHYCFETEALSVSAAEHIEDVDKDPIVLFDGLTKNWRYPGFRVCWTVGPPEIIDAVASAGSFLDGGCARPMQLAAIPLVDPKVANQEAKAIKQSFTNKRQLMLEGLRELGIAVTPEPGGSFYCWGDLSALPKKLNTGMALFRQALEVGVIIVPGVFFDINPGKRRPDRAARFGHFARFSFGPPEEELKRGLEKLKTLVTANS